MPDFFGGTNYFLVGVYAGDHQLRADAGDRAGPEDCLQHAQEDPRDPGNNEMGPEEL